ncbi:putative RNA methyltransferase [Oceanobacillus jeddahense]|uniref:putative RNA methyltransferase n=1 Tax=Oceanobacillus jeddahense TaxID=1462527 RepID=UPI000A86AFBF|nr:methyltransferase domain-containing protein [Oceanobacillus jeddahense]
MSKITKKVKSAKHVSEFESIFKCPICEASMKVFELKSFICLNNHTFDFTKQGYINLTTHPIKAKYSKELFEARRKLIAEDKFFEPLIQAIAEIIRRQADIKKESLLLLDTGCGEGSHLSNVCEKVRPDFGNTVTGAGIDISKEGVLAAAKNYTNQIWAVADLANTPFKDKQFDVILDILSPSNYAEFNRLLRADGLVIKVVPRSGYLKEIREALFDERAKQEYSNIETVDRFNENFQKVDSLRVQYTRELNNLSMQSLVFMTPLTWTAKEERIKLFLERDSADITVDLEILIGRKTN